MFKAVIPGNFDSKWIRTLKELEQGLLCYGGFTEQVITISSRHQR